MVPPQRLTFPSCKRRLWIHALSAATRGIQHCYECFSGSPNRLWWSHLHCSPFGRQLYRAFPKFCWAPSLVQCWNCAWWAPLLGYDCDVHLLKPHDVAFCINTKIDFDRTNFTYVFVNVDTKDAQGVFLHSSAANLTEFELMKFLHQLDYKRGVILSDVQVAHKVHRVSFQDAVGTAAQDDKHRLPSPWPPPQPDTYDRTPVSTALNNLHDNDTAFRLKFANDITAVQHLLCSGQDLYQDWEHLDLPQHVKTAIQECSPWEPNIPLHRLVIYTDGSSGVSRHTVPGRIESADTPVDSWAFVVLGERYPEAGEPGALFFLGWQSQPVLYGEDKLHYIGADRIGSDIAEREGLFWAMMWRIGRNSRIPTCFRPDNQMVIGQARGEYGTQERTLAFNCLRGAHQLLEAMLPAQALQLSHARGHCGEPWNDFADAAAKSESKRSHYLHRQPIDIRQWTADLPYLWTIFASDLGLPPLTADGHCPTPVQLPIYEPEIEAEEPELCQAEITLSICSGNVQSLYRGPDGHAGKVQYLRAQMAALQLNVMGIQEARSEAGTTCVDSILRLASGAEGHNYGVEFWVNLQQPVAYCTGRKPHYFARSDFTVVLAEPRLMIVHTVNEVMDVWFVIGHAPQSGRSAVERHQWWQHLANSLETHVHEGHVFFTLDANAATGPNDDVHIGGHDDITSCNTPHLREFLNKFDLCIPATFQMHQGPHHTWTRSDGAIDSRIDYIVVPRPYLYSCQLSRVVPEFDLGSDHDHSAVAIELQWIGQLGFSDSSKRPLTRRCPRATNPEYETLSNAALASLKVPAWQTDIGTHVDHFNCNVHTWMSSGQKTHRIAKRSYITAELWQLRCEKLRHRRELRELQSSTRSTLLATIFRAWRGTPHPAPATSGADQTLNDTRSIVVAARLAEVSKALKHGLRQTKQQAIQTCLEALPSGTCASGILQALKQQMGPSNPKKVKKMGDSVAILRTLWTDGLSTSWRWKEESVFARKNNTWSGHDILRLSRPTM